MSIKKYAPREHLRCPLCGKLVRFERSEKGVLPSRFREVHGLDVKIQLHTGGGWKGKGTGFLWSERPMTAEERVELREILVAKLETLDDEVELDEGLESIKNKEEFEARAKRYIAEAEQVAVDAAAALAARKREVEELAKRWRKVA